MQDSESLLRYYTDELTYLRTMGRRFAERYPKIAGRLELSAGQCADPDVERMMQSFAILTARLQRRLDGEFPEITSALLGALYPNLADPVPPMAIARFDADPAQGKLTGGHRIEPRTPLFSTTPDGLTCRFQTCYPVTLWPLEVTEAAFEAPARFPFLDSAAEVASVLRIRVEGPLEGLNLKRLRFYINAEPALANEMYELLFCHVLRVAVPPEDGGRPVELPPGSILPVGFGPGEEVIPCPANGLPAYRLLQEYFLFPDKFLFFDLDGLDQHRSKKALDILILLGRSPRGRAAVDRRTFCLGCSPVVNLFSRTSEPTRIDERRFEYRLSPDARRERTTEAHSIVAVSSSSNPAERAAELDPFYSFRHGGGERRSFWYARRVPAEGGMPGTDLMLSFVGPDFAPELPAARAVYAHLLCTNRDLAPRLPAGAALQAEEAAPLARITCLRKPTPAVYPPMAGRTMWRLISNLSVNYLPLAGGEGAVSGGVDALREILRLYSLSDQPSIHQQMQGIRRMDCRRVTRRLGVEPWRGFCQGTEVTLTFDESQYAGGGAFLLAAVLNRFLPLYASINSFTQLAIVSEQREGEWKRWAPAAGYQELV